MWQLYFADFTLLGWGGGVHCNTITVIGQRDVNVYAVYSLPSAGYVNKNLLVKWFVLYMPYKYECRVQVVCVSELCVWKSTQSNRLCFYHLTLSDSVSPCLSQALWSSYPQWRGGSSARYDWVLSLWRKKETGSASCSPSISSSVRVAQEASCTCSKWVSHTRTHVHTPYFHVQAQGLCKLKQLSSWTCESFLSVLLD